MIVNLFFFIVLELGSGFCQNLSQFLAVRSLYGIAMGGEILQDSFYFATFNANIHQVCLVQRLLQHLKTSPTMLEVSYLVSSRWVMQLATCLPPHSTELLSQRHLMGGGVFSGLEPAHRC